MRAKKSKIKVMVHLHPVRVFFLAYRLLPLCCVLTWQEDRAGLSFLLIRALSPL